MVKVLPKWHEQLIRQADRKFEGRPLAERNQWYSEEYEKRKRQEEERIHEIIWGKKYNGPIDSDSAS